MIRCRNGHLNPDGATYCSVCHTYIDAAAEHVEPVPAPPPEPSPPEQPPPEQPPPEPESWPTPPPRPRPLVSLAQTALTLVAVVRAGSDAPGTTAALVHAVDVADTVKLVLLAVFVPVVTVAARRAGMLPRWMSGVAIALVVLLPLGGASFLVPNGLLGMLLVVSLPVLLVWAGTVALLVGRRAH
jgi:hypothetical protein